MDNKYGSRHIALLRSQAEIAIFSHKYQARLEILGKSLPISSFYLLRTLKRPKRHLQRRKHASITHLSIVTMGGLWFYHHWSSVNYYYYVIVIGGLMDRRDVMQLRSRYQPSMLEILINDSDVHLNQLHRRFYLCAYVLLKETTVKPVCNDHHSNKMYFL